MIELIVLGVTVIIVIVVLSSLNTIASESKKIRLLLLRQDNVSVANGQLPPLPVPGSTYNPPNPINPGVSKQ